MAIFYSDNPTLSLATAIYTDAALTIKAPDGYYSDQTISRRQDGGILLAAEACANCSANPATSTLTFESYNAGLGSLSKFYFFLTNPLVTDAIVIEGAQVSAYTSTNCSTIEAASDFLPVAITIPAGVNNGNGSGSGMACESTGLVSYKKFNSITVNGTSVFNGSVIDIGGCLVTIVINTACESLECVV